MNPNELNQLVDRIATAGPHEVIRSEDRDLVLREIATNADFARRTAETFLTIQSLRLTELGAPTRAPQFAASQPTPVKRPWQAAAAALIIGLVAGHFSSNDSDSPAGDANEIPSLAIQSESRTEFEPRPEMRSLSVKPYHYDDGLFSGKSIVVQTRND